MEEHEGEAESWTSSCLLSRNNDNIQLKRENCSCKEKMCIQDWRKHTHTCVHARTHAHRCACKLVCRLLYITNLCSCGTVYEWLQSGVAFGQKILTIIVMSGQLQLGERYISSRRSPRHKLDPTSVNFNNLFNRLKSCFRLVSNFWDKKLFNSGVFWRCSTLMLCIQLDTACCGETKLNLE